MTTETPCNGCKALKSDPFIVGLVVTTTLDTDADGKCEFTEGIGCEQIKTCKLAGSMLFSRVPQWGIPHRIKSNWPGGPTVDLDDNNPEAIMNFALGNHDCGSGEKVVFSIQQLMPSGWQDLGVVKVKCTGC